MKSYKSKALKGYQARDSGTHRKYDFGASTRRYKRTGTIIYRGKGSAKGSGHAAGEKWGETKEINPESKATKYSKNSPSFDEGVYLYKEKTKSKALINKRNDSI